MLTIEMSADITVLVLAGGLATRLGGADKGLQALHGKPLIEHVLERLQPQSSKLMINCNRNTEIYARYGHPLVADLLPDHPGPLAGLHAGLHQCSTPLIATVPCDAPFLPADLIPRLHEALADAPAVFACSPAQQPVFALYRCTVLPALEQFLADGRRGVGQFLSHIGAHAVDFSDRQQAFQNFNSADDWPRC